MKYRFLGSSGLHISHITLGTMRFSAPEWSCDQTEAHTIWTFLSILVETGCGFDTTRSDRWGARTTGRQPRPQRATGPAAADPQSPCGRSADFGGWVGTRFSKSSRI